MAFARHNATTITHTPSLRRMEDCIEYIREAKIFSALDTLRDYWHVLIAESTATARHS